MRSTDLFSWSVTPTAARSSRPRARPTTWSVSSTSPALPRIEGENLTDLQSKFPAPGIVPYIVQHQLPDGGAEFTLSLDGFHESFCADLPADDAAFLAIAQRPLAGVSLTEAAPTPAWRSRPSWAVLPTADRAIDPGVHHFSYERAGATVTEIEGASHVSMISHPKEVAEVVMTAVRTCAAQPPDPRTRATEGRRGRR